jgi:hypothetical protein
MIERRVSDVIQLTGRQNLVDLIFGDVTEVLFGGALARTRAPFRNSIRGRLPEALINTTGNKFALCHDKQGDRYLQACRY